MARLGLLAYAVSLTFRAGSRSIISVIIFYCWDHADMVEASLFLSISSSLFDRRCFPNSLPFVFNIFEAEAEGYG